jgi:hypothetical protein
MINEFVKKSQNYKITNIKYLVIFLFSVLYIILLTSLINLNLRERF